MNVTETDPDDAAAFDAWYAVVQADQEAERPGEPGWQRQELQAHAVAGRGEATPVRVRLLSVRQDGETVGAARLDLPQRDNRHLAELFFLVAHPAHRRRGVGRALLDAAVRVAEQEGRRDLVVTVHETPAQQGRAPGRAFAARAGFTCAQEEVRRDLRVPVDPARLDALEAACAPHAAGYALRTWEGECPDDLVEDRALLAQRMSTDAPSGQVDRAEESWDVARVRALEQLLRDQGRVRLSAGAVHEATGRLVAFTDLCLPAAVPERAYQWDTLVLREHRGHRLGTLVKLADLRRLPQAWPRTRWVSTWNAAENAPMIAVNEALGCVVAGTTGVWQRPVAG